MALFKRCMPPVNKLGRSGKPEHGKRQKVSADHHFLISHFSQTIILFANKSLYAHVVFSFGRGSDIADDFARTHVVRDEPEPADDVAHDGHGQGKVHPAQEADFVSGCDAGGIVLVECLNLRLENQVYRSANQRANAADISRKSNGLNLGVVKFLQL